MTNYDRMMCCSVFDLEKAKAGNPVCTAEGNLARIICFDAKGGNYPILALVKQNDDPDNDSEVLQTYSIQGWYHDDNGDYEHKNLCMVSDKITLWFNIFRGDDYSLSTSIGYTTEENALDIAEGNPNYITTVSSEYYV